MRKWHRWLTVFFGIFLLWIAITGFLSQVVPMVQAPPAPVAMPEGFVCPETMTCRPKRTGPSLVGTLHHLHSGESFGPVGVAVFTLAGLAMVFFSFSGLWVYIQMWRNRKDRKLKPGFFWK